MWLATRGTGDGGCFWKPTWWWYKGGEPEIHALPAWQIFCWVYAAKTPDLGCTSARLCRSSLEPYHSWPDQVKVLFTPCKRNFGTHQGHALYLKIFELFMFYITWAFECKQHPWKETKRKQYKRCAKELWLFCVSVWTILPNSPLVCIELFILCYVLKMSDLNHLKSQKLQQVFFILGINLRYTVWWFDIHWKMIITIRSANTLLHIMTVCVCVCVHMCALRTCKIYC